MTSEGLTSSKNTKLSGDEKRIIRCKHSHTMVITEIFFSVAEL